MKIAENVERHYRSFIDREQPLDFFKGLAEYLKYILTVPVLKEVFDKQLAEREAHYKKIEKYELQSRKEFEQAKIKLLKSIAKTGIDSASFIRYQTHSIPPFEDFFDHLKAWENGGIQMSGFDSDRMEDFLFDMAANLLQRGHKEELKEFLVSDEEYSDYYHRINGRFNVIRNEHGNFIFSKTWPCRWEESALFTREQSLKPWGSFEKLDQFRTAYDAVSKNENFWYLSLHTQKIRKTKNTHRTQATIDISEMVEDLKLLIGEHPFSLARWKGNPQDVENKLDRLHKNVFRTVVDIVHNQLMHRAIEQDSTLAMMEKVVDEQNKRRDSYIIQQEAAPYFPIKLGTPYNPNPEPTLVRVVDGEINVRGLKEGLEKIVKPKSGKQSGKNIFPFKIPAGTRWENVTIIFTSNNFVNIQVAGHIHQTGYADIGFVDSRTQKPNYQWGFLLVLAKNGGSLLPTSPDAQTNYKKQKQHLSDRLQKYFGMESDPFETYNKRYNRNGYKIRITLIPPPPETTNTEKTLDDISGEVDTIFKEFTQ